MNVVAPVRPTEAIPYAESQPQRQLRHASPEWLPVIGWFVDDGRRHSRINVVPPQTMQTMRENVQWIKNQT